MMMSLHAAHKFVLHGSRVASMSVNCWSAAKHRVMMVVVGMVMRVTAEMVVTGAGWMKEAAIWFTVVFVEVVIVHVFAMLRLDVVH